MTRPPSAPPPVSSPLQPQGVFHLRGWLGILTLGPLGAAAILSGRPWPEGTWQDQACDLLGYALLFLGLYLRTLATLHLGGRKSRHLVTQGIYSVTRNPLYLGSLLIGLSAGVLLQSLSLLLGVLILGPLLYLPVIREEERILHANHGETFEEYRRRVPRIFPRRLPPRMREREHPVDLRAFRAHLLRSACTLLLIPANEFLAAAQAHGLIPVLLHLP